MADKLSSEKHKKHAKGLEKELKKKDKKSASLEWHNQQNKESQDYSYCPPYGSLTELNTSRLILDSVGEETLTDIAKDYLDLLGSSSAIYEENGDYALGIFSSGWCRFLDNASRNLCDTDSNRSALNCGQWLCHESCWNNASKVSIEKRAAVDIECNGGIRLYAIPIWAKDKVIGAMNFGYGDPPTEPEKLKQISELYKVDINELHRLAEQYKSRSPFLVDIAKKQLSTSAKLIGQIIELKLTEKELIQEHDFSKSLIDIAQAIILVLNPDGTIQSFNPYMEKVSGYGLEEVKGKDWFEMFLPNQDWKSVRALFRKAISDTQTHGNVNPIITKDGRQLYIEWHDKTIRDSKDNVLGLLAIGQDITERKRAAEELEKAHKKLEQKVQERTAKLSMANEELGREIEERKRVEEALRESKNFLLNIFSSIQDGISILDTGLNITRVNHAIEKWYSHTMPLVGKKCYEAYHERNKPCDECPVIKTLETGQPACEVVPKRHSGGKTVGWLELYSFPIVDDCTGQFQGVIEYVRDITERRRMEEALRESEEKFRLTFENARDAIFWADPQTGIIINCNKAAELLVEKDRKEILGQHQSTLHPVDKSKFYSDMFNQHIERNGFVDEEAEVITKTGKTILVRITASKVMIGGKPVIQGIFRDITKFKQAEEVLKKSSEKIKLFAYSVSHDLKNPAIATYGLAKLLYKNYQEYLDEKGKNLCDQILKSSEQIAALAEKINFFISTKETTLSIERIKLKEILQMIREEFTVPLNLRQIKWREPEHLPEIKADRLAILRILRNFVDNALKHGGDHLSRIEIGYEESVGYHILSVTDDGKGLEKEETKRIFGWFERTSGEVKGVGLGLAIVKEIVEQHKGEVWVEQPGPDNKGITFSISISKWLS
jgi:PAS domain S-box-containing protein